MLIEDLIQESQPTDTSAHCAPPRVRALVLAKQVAQLSQRDRAAGWVSNSQKWKTGTERQYSTTATYLASKEIEIGEKTQNKGCDAVKGNSRSSKVIEVSSNRKPVWDFLLVINSNYHPISYVSDISQLIVQILDTLRF